MRTLIAWIFLSCVTSPLWAQATTTVITHGFQLNGAFPTWSVAMGSRIADASTPLGTVLVRDPQTGSWNPVYGSGDPNGALVLCFDWAESSSWSPTTGDRVGTAVAAADVLYASLRDPDLTGLLAGESVLATATGDPRPLHFIGHSRGASLHTAVVERLSAAGIPVDHQTALDPHPIGPTANLQDPPMAIYEGVTFADNYYRADGCDFDNGCLFFDFDGEPIAGAWNVDLGLDAFSFGDNRLAPCTLEHILVHTWYHGTVDLNANNDGDCSIERPDWYLTDGSDEGFYYSVLGGGNAQRPCGPSGGCSDAGRVPPGEIPAIVNGDFEFGPGQPAGWQWLGGGESGAIIASGGEIYLELSDAAPSRRHNPFFIPSDASELTFDLRVIDFDLSTTLEVSLIEVGPAVELDIASIDLSTTTPWSPQTVPLPANLTGKTVELRVALSSSMTSARIGLDNFDLAAASVIEFLRGDCNADAGVNVADAVFALGALFGSGPFPGCTDPCDTNDDGSLDISDPITLLGSLFGGGAPLPPPASTCGGDPTSDNLPCPLPPLCSP